MWLFHRALKTAVANLDGEGAISTAKSWLSYALLQWPIQCY